MPHDTKFARLEFGAFYFAITILTFYEIVKKWWIQFILNSPVFNIPALDNT